MNRKILFSPIGGTDPISEVNIFDGAMLHISRHYKPEVVYLFLSQEMLNKHHQDNRYVRCLEWLGEKLDHEFEVRVIEKPDWQKVHLFNMIYEEIYNEIHKIVSDMDDTDELLLNMSSGTPAMKSALIVLVNMLKIKCTCIQVDTPVDGMNEQQHDKNPEIELLWEFNGDNQPGARNRCHIETLDIVRKLESEESIISLVKTYRYKDALQLAEQLNSKYTDKYLDKLRFAAARKDLDFRTTGKMLDKVDLKIYSPVRRENAHKIYEYTLLLKNKVACGEYTDFIRGLSPIFFTIGTSILEKQADFKYEDYVKTTSNGIDVWDESALMKKRRVIDALDREFGKFRFGWPKFTHLKTIAKCLIREQKIVASFVELREIEQKLRNVVSHTLTNMTDASVKKEMGCTCEDLLKTILDSFKYTSFNIPPKAWDSYEDMNADIILSIRGNISENEGKK